MRTPKLAITGHFPCFEVHENGKRLAAFKYKWQAEQWASRYIHRPTIRAYRWIMGILGALAIGAAITAMPLKVLLFALLLLLSAVTVAGAMLYSRRTEIEALQESVRKLKQTTKPPHSTRGAIITKIERKMRG